MKIERATDIDSQIHDLVHYLEFSHIQTSKIVCMRSYESKANARARIWSFPNIWQMALNLKPHYVIEVLSEKFDHLSDDDKKRVLIHELLHIPKNFSGSLVPHKGRYHSIDHKRVEKLFFAYKTSKKTT